MFRESCATCNVADVASINKTRGTRSRLPHLLNYADEHAFSIQHDLGVIHTSLPSKLFQDFARLFPLII